MFNQGLSLDQAPPISVPFRFFITTPIFAIIIGIVILFSNSELLVNKYSNVAIGLVHLFTLGMLTMIIFGAMQQMMPVLAGAVIKRVKLFANVVHLGLTLGTIFFSASFILEDKSLLLPGIILLSISFATFFITAIWLLFRVKYLTSTVKAMKLFSLAGLITVLLGLYLAGAHVGDNIGAKHYIFVNAHMMFGLFGFAMLLIMGVAFQVIPMFYVSKDFPKFVQNRLPVFIFVLIALFFLLTLFSINVYVIKLLLTVVFIIFAVYAIDSLNNRRRPVFDVTLWYWKLSLYMLIISMLNWMFVPQDSSYLLSILFAFGFLYALLQGMVYKIIPFLAWFHLSSKGYFVIPTIREMITEDLIKIHFFIYVSSLVSFLLAGFLSAIFIYLAAFLFIVSNIIFIYNLTQAIKKYNKILKTDPMAMMSVPK